MKSVPFNSVTSAKNFKGNGCLCPIRIFPLGGINKHFIETEINKDTNYIVQVRDPRDVLTSQYFYFYNCVDKGNDYKKEAKKYVRSHTINEYAKSKLGTDYLINKYSSLFKLKEYNNITFITYEDMVQNFRKWVTISTKHFNLTNGETKTLVNKFKKEFVNIVETDPKKITAGLRKSHMRRVYSGDYKNKFTKESIRYLNSKFINHLNFMQQISINYKY
jgi:hypothetical protein